MPKKKYKKQMEKTAKKYWLEILCVILALVIIFVVCYYTIDAFKVKVDGWIASISQPSESGSTSNSDTNFDTDSSTNGDTDSSSNPSGGDILAKYQQYSEDYSYYDFPVTTRTEKYVEVHFIDIGQGGCMFIQLPDGKTMMIDSGDTSNKNKATIKEYLTDKLHVEKIDYVLATHQDKDHIGNFDYVYKNYSIGYTFLPYVHSSHESTSALSTKLNPPANGGLVSATKTYADLLLSVEAEGTEYSFFNYNSDFGNESEGYFFDFLTPTQEVANIKYTDSNDYSPMILFTYGGFDLLFTGDAEKQTIKEYLDTYGNRYDVDLLKVGHHGSYTSTTKELLDAINPEYAVIQVGLNNKHKHPRQEALDLLYQNDMTKIFRNDLHGDIVLTINSDGTFFITAENTDVSYGRALTGISV